MRTVYAPDHARHDPQVEMADGKLVPAVEIPARAQMVLEAVRDADFGAILAPDRLDRGCVEQVHNADYVQFLESFWQRWLEAGRDPQTHDTFPFIWPAQGGPSGLRKVRPSHLDGLMGYYSFDAGTPMGPGTWAAASASASVAQTAAKLVANGEHQAFALCRPPGHHAMPDAYGGYCFLNNAAIAAQTLRNEGASKVAVLDVDYHHGNGTQAIFYERDDVFFASLHADPMDEYPYFLGHGDETGRDAGQGFNLNLPLPLGTEWAGYAQALARALAAIEAFGADALVISLGLDIYERDPISQFKLAHDDFTRLGEMLGAVRMPTVIVFEGGYAVDALAVNAVNTLTGFLNARRD